MQLSEVSCSAHKQTERPTQKVKLRPLSEHTLKLTKWTSPRSADESPRSTERGVFATDVLKWRYDLHEL